MIEIFLLFSLYHTCVNNAFKEYAGCSVYAYERGVDQLLFV